MPQSTSKGLGLALCWGLLLLTLFPGLESPASAHQVEALAGPALDLPVETRSKNAPNHAEWRALAAEGARLQSLAAELTATERRLKEWQAKFAATALSESNDINAISQDVRSSVAAQQQVADLRQHVEGSRVSETIAAQNQPSWRVDNPFTPERLLQWGVDHGPRLLTILIAAFALYLVVKLSGRHLAKLVAHGGSRGTLHERENRAITLVGVFQNVATIAVLVGGSLMLLDEVGIPILPLMGGAAVLGLAVAFGSQNLIKDYFSGFMLLMEDQYGVNDVIKIGETSGAVEQITLRITVLRDLEGVVHFIPHGTITTVSNMTHGWSRALLDIAVAYKEDTDRVMALMLEVAQELRGDEQFGPLILEDAEMLGVDLLGDSSISVKMVIKTHPLKRWAVRREYLRRIKQRFDQVGIEIPFPYRNVLVRQIDGAKRVDAEAA